ncbi:conjugative transfer signal peptidase TraF [Photobacterium damselae]|uniref:conjugative transfer signal peptidase TraF n=1 Tax=Photobacterium damselae TaxID=38293 RepID=UPI0014325543|nr:conjugative transfer signal peptidase TraF [Photobacterium damselae]
MKKTVKTISIIGLIFISLIFYLYLSGYRYNHSTSYPTGIYQLTNRPMSYKLGQLVLFCPPNNPIMQEALKRHYLRRGFCQGGFEPVIKKVFAVGGDNVSFKDNRLFINAHVIPNMIMLNKDSQGRALPKRNDEIISKNSYFLLSDHQPKISFDSRYYGSVPADNIKGVAIPIYIF